MTIISSEPSRADLYPFYKVGKTKQTQAVSISCYLVEFHLISGWGGVDREEGPEVGILLLVPQWQCHIALSHWAQL